MLSVLPRALRERTVVLNDAPASRGRYVLYWMHHALRVNENPALDVARLAAAELDLPLLVCQGLGGAHPYQNDRHHFFALQCARDVANDLAAYGIHYRFHLDARRHGSVASLMPDAALTVFEQMPVAPFPKWQASLSARAGSSVLRVDARCIVPMPLMTKRYDRAFAFRKAAIDLFDARVLSAYPSLDVGLPTGDEDLSVGALDVRPLDDGALLDLVASCPIDHSVAPVFETVGGSAAGYARWQAFRNGGLRSYHQTRNDAAIAPPAGVSRLSPYLHYGCVSPMRVAREAQQVGGAGAEKFLDELFVWRELAHNFCAHSPQLETLDALPAWASETLRAHANDPRPAIFSWDTLAHARTGEPLWDTAQRSLLRHGELHNNVRMTWA
ncbi:MAG: deoxyribodipyrimidine photo-lyase, partial [Gammaproteobacteria bacterium]